MSFDPAVWIALGSLVVNFIAVYLINQRHTVKNTESRKEDMLQLERTLRESVELLGRRFGETIGALREKVVQTELWNRDNFIDKITFNTVVRDIKDSGSRLEEKIDKRFDVADRKLEKLLNGDR